MSRSSLFGAMVDPRRVRIIGTSLVTTFIVIRSTMQLLPETDFNVAGYNIHHLFTGVILITAGGIPLAIFPGRSRILDLAAVLFGSGLSLALDEWVYLIATDGTNASYLLPISLRGGVLMIALAVAYLIVLYKASRSGPR